MEASQATEQYFESMDRELAEYKHKFKVFFREHKLSDEDRYSEAYLKVFNSFTHENPFPLSHAQMQAYHTWKFHRDYETEYLACELLPFEDEMSDFIQALLTAKAEYLAIADTSTDLMKSLHQLAKMGCKFQTLAEIVCRDKYETTIRPAIVVRLPKKNATKKNAKPKNERENKQ